MFTKIKLMIRIRQIKKDLEEIIGMDLQKLPIKEQRFYKEKYAALLGEMAYLTKLL